MLHKVKIFPVYDTLRTILKIDDMRVRANEYVIRQEAGELPRLELELAVTPVIEDDRVICHVSNKEEIARLMDADEFSEFCTIWHEIHS